MLIRLIWVDATDEVQVLDPGEAFAIAKGVDDPEPEGTYSIITANGHDGIQIAGTAHALHDWLNRARARLISKTDGPRIMSVLDLSTHHLPQHVCDQLSAYDGVTAHHTPYGWLLAGPGYLAGHRTDHSGAVPDAVWALWEYAHRFDAEYLLLDADADRVDALASWDW